MKKTTTSLTLLAAWGLALALAGAAGDATPKSNAPPSGRACFYANQADGFAAVDDSTVNLRVGVRDVYQLKLFATCPDIDWSQHLGLRSRGSSWICEGNGLDLDIFTPSSIGPQRCPVTSVRKLTAAEITALPARQRP
jgi:hypothetical protein